MDSFHRSNDILFVLYHQNINTYVILYICYSYMQEANIFIPGEVVILKIPDAITNKIVH